MFRKPIALKHLQVFSSLFNENPDKFISRFVTVDETWLHHFDPESKAKSMAW